MKCHLQDGRVRLLLAISLTAASGMARAQGPAAPDPTILVKGRVEATGPEIRGVISARLGNKIKVVETNGESTSITVDETTRITAGGGLFGSRRSDLGAEALLNGLPVIIKTLRPRDGQFAGGLLASQISFKNSDFRTASMIRSATAQRFDEQSAATEALRGRLGDIDKYNVKSTTNVHFDTGRAELSAQDKADLCTAAQAAEKTENALLLVVGYTDSTGPDDLNQQLSEKRAGRVINYLQQVCGWKPYRMLTPTGMAKADPMASNDTPEGKAQNRRVAVNILVSKTVDGM